MKVLCVLLLLISSVLAKETFFQVNIPYTEGRVSFQGSYFLKPNKDGLVSLKKFGIERVEKLTAEQIEAIVKKAFSVKSGGAALNNITVKEVIYDQEKLIKNNEVLVTGQVQTPGSHNITKHKTLGEIIALAKPSAFGSTRRIMLLRNAKIYKYDLKKAEHAAVKIHAGDMITIPQKRYFGR